MAALIRGLNRKIPSELVKARILDPNSVEQIGSLAGITVTGGRLNAYRTIYDRDTNPPSQITSLVANNPTTTSIQLAWTAVGDDGIFGRATLYQVRYSTSQITNDGFFLAERAFNEPAPLMPGEPQSMTVGGLQAGTHYYLALKAYDEWGNGPLSNVVSCNTYGACPTSFCKEQAGEPFRCTSIGYGTCNCCAYSCVPDESCTSPDPCPATACSGVCPLQ